MQAITFAFILALALAGACRNDAKNREIPPATEASDSIQETSANRQPAKEESRLREALSEEPDTLYLVSGTEPFWSLAVARPHSIYTSADGDTLVFDFKEARQASARPEEYVQVFELGSEQQLVLRKANDCPCSDGMSDRAYPYQATLILAEKILEGCGRKPENGS